MRHHNQIVEHAHGTAMPSIASLIRQHTDNDTEAGHSVLHFRRSGIVMPWEGMSNPALIRALDGISAGLMQGERDYTLSMVPSQSLHSDKELELFESDGVEMPDFTSIFSSIETSLRHSHDLQGNYVVSIDVRPWKGALSVHVRWQDEPKRDQLDFYVSPSSFTVDFLDVVEEPHAQAITRWYAGMFSGEISTVMVF